MSHPFNCDCQACHPTYSPARTFPAGTKVKGVKFGVEYTGVVVDGKRYKSGWDYEYHIDLDNPIDVFGETFHKGMFLVTTGGRSTIEMA
jgi:hypothetical protein